MAKKRKGGDPRKQGGGRVTAKGTRPAEKVPHRVPALFGASQERRPKGFKGALLDRRNSALSNPAFLSALDAALDDRIIALEGHVEAS